MSLDTGCLASRGSLKATTSPTSAWATLSRRILTDIRSSSEMSTVRKHQSSGCPPSGGRKSFPTTNPVCLFGMSAPSLNIPTRPSGTHSISGDTDAGEKISELWATSGCGSALSLALAGLSLTGLATLFILALSALPPGGKGEP